MKRLIRIFVVGLTVNFFLAHSAPSAIITPILGPGGFLSTTTITNHFDSGAPMTAPANMPQVTFDSSAKLGTAAAWTGGVTSSGGQGLVVDFEDSPMRFDFPTPVNEIGMYFGNDDFGRIFDATLELFDAGNVSLGSVQVRSNGNDFADQYIGARSSVAATSATIYYEQPNALLLAIYIDDLTVGVVPEPTGVALAVCGLLGLAAGAHRARRQCSHRLSGE